jgi:hypothetical protein
MTRLTDTQLVILSAASQRDDHLAVLPANLKGGAVKAVATKLLNQRLLREVRVKGDQPAWHADEGGRPFGLKITAAGLAAIGVDGDGGKQADDVSMRAPTPRKGSKQGKIIDLLRRHKGATLDDLIAATDWLPHTIRAALTGLRKKRYEIGKSKREDGKTVYRIMALPSDRACAAAE